MGQKDAKGEGWSEEWSEDTEGHGKDIQQNETVAKEEPEDAEGHWQAGGVGEQWSEGKEWSEEG